MLRCTRFVLASAVMLAATSLGNSHAAQQQFPKPNPTNDRPVMEVDLHKFADANWNPGRSEIAGGTLRSEIHFVDGDSLMWAWITRDNNFAPAKRNAPFPPPTGKLHAVLLDATTGQEKAKRDWLAPTVGAVRFALNDGILLTCVDKKIELFSPRFELLAERELSENNGCVNVKSLGFSGSSGKTRFFFLSYGYGATSRVDILDAVTLEVVSTSSGNSMDIPGRWQAGFCGKPRQVCVRQGDGAWQVLKSRVASEQGSGYDHRSALFVNDDTVLIRNDREMELAKVDGSVLFEVKLPRDRSYDRHVFGEPGVASGGDRFAIMESRMRGINSGFLDESKQPSDDEIVVYSISERRAIFAVKVKGSSVWPPFIQHTNEFALSPDGDRLAVVSDGVLKIYKLPERQSAH